MSSHWVYWAVILSVACAKRNRYPYGAPTNVEDLSDYYRWKHVASCPQGTAPCKFRTCVDNEFLCDGFNNCEGGSDEEDCKFSHCPPHKISCNGKCVMRKYLCRSNPSDCGSEYHKVDCEIYKCKEFLDHCNISPGWEKVGLNKSTTRAEATSTSGIKEVSDPERENSFGTMNGQKVGFDGKVRSDSEIEQASETLEQSRLEIEQTNPIDYTTESNPHHNSHAISEESAEYSDWRNHRRRCPDRVTCDGYGHCEGGWDEEGCRWTECSPYKMYCNGKCIHGYHLCSINPLDCGHGVGKVECDLYKCEDFLNKCHIKSLWGEDILVRLTRNLRKRRRRNREMFISRYEQGDSDAKITSLRRGPPFNVHEIADFKKWKHGHDCGIDAVPCSSGTCIHHKLLCDGFNDCEGGSDEEYCNYTMCPMREISCNGKCVIPSDLCKYNPSDCGPEHHKVDCEVYKCKQFLHICRFNPEWLKFRLKKSSATEEETSTSGIKKVSGPETDKGFDATNGHDVGSGGEVERERTRKAETDNYFRQKSSGFRSEDSSEIGSGKDLGSGSGNDLGSDSDNDLGSGSGNDLGPGSGNDLGSGSGNDLGSGSGDDLGSGSGNDLGSDSGNGLGSGSGNDLGSGSGNDLGSDSGNGLGSGSGNDLVSGSGNDLGSGSGQMTGLGNELHFDADIGSGEDYVSRNKQTLGTETSTPVSLGVGGSITWEADDFIFAEGSGDDIGSERKENPVSEDRKKLDSARPEEFIPGKRDDLSPSLSTGQSNRPTGDSSGLTGLSTTPSNDHSTGLSTGSPTGPSTGHSTGLSTGPSNGHSISSTTGLSTSLFTGHSTSQVNRQDHLRPKSNTDSEHRQNTDNSEMKEKPCVEKEQESGAACDEKIPEAVHNKREGQETTVYVGMVASCVVVALVAILLVVLIKQRRRKQKELKLLAYQNMTYR